VGKDVRLGVVGEGLVVVPAEDELLQKHPAGQAGGHHGVATLRQQSRFVPRGIQPLRGQIQVRGICKVMMRCRLTDEEEDTMPGRTWVGNGVRAGWGWDEHVAYVVGTRGDGGFHVPLLRSGTDEGAGCGGMRTSSTTLAPHHHRRSSSRPRTSLRSNGHGRSPNLQTLDPPQP
jgi:hypothetical protein